MTRKLTLAAAALAAGLVTGQANAKAHDMGAADGDNVPGQQTGAKTNIDALEDLGLLDGRGVSNLTKGGARGDAASAAGGGNRTDPVVGNGANAD